MHRSRPMRLEVDMAQEGLVYIKDFMANSIYIYRVVMTAWRYRIVGSFVAQPVDIHHCCNVCWGSGDSW